MQVCLLLQVCPSSIKMQTPVHAFVTVSLEKCRRVGQRCPVLGRLDHYCPRVIRTAAGHKAHNRSLPKEKGSCRWPTISMTKSTRPYT
jgi:hypothetical protein